MKNLLMCYDDALIVDLVRISLEDKGVNVIGLPDPSKISSMIDQFDPIAVILDFNMVKQPNHGVRNLLKEKTTPVVIFSSELNGGKHLKDMEIDHYVKKSPYGFDELEKIVDQVISKEIETISI